MGIRENVVLIGIGVAAEFPLDADLIACAAQVCFAQAQDTYQAVRIGIAGADSNGTSLLFYDVDFNDDVLGIFLARQQADVDVFKVARIIDALNASAGNFAVKYVALLETQFPENNLIPRLRIAAQRNVFYMDFRYADMENSFFVEADFRHAVQHVAGIIVRRIDGGNVAADNRRIEHRARRNRNELFDIAVRKGLIPCNLYAVDDRVHLNGVVQLNPFGYVGKGRFNRRKDARRADDVQVMADIGHIDGVADAHSQSRKDVFLDFFIRYRADRNRRSRLVEVRRDVAVRYKAAVGQVDPAFRRNDSHRIVGNAGIYDEVADSSRELYRRARQFGSRRSRSCCRLRCSVRCCSRSRFSRSRCFRGLRRSFISSTWNSNRSSAFLGRSFGGLMNFFRRLAFSNCCQLFLRFIPSQPRLGRRHRILRRLIGPRRYRRIDGHLFSARHSCGRNDIGGNDVLTYWFISRRTGSRSRLRRRFVACPYRAGHHCAGHHQDKKLLLPRIHTKPPFIYSLRPYRAGYGAHLVRPAVSARLSAPLSAQARCVESARQLLMPKQAPLRHRVVPARLSASPRQQTLHEPAALHMVQAAPTPWPVQPAISQETAVLPVRHPVPAAPSRDFPWSRHTTIQRP